jgi:hypothetical protein
MNNKRAPAGARFSSTRLESGATCHSGDTDRQNVSPELSPLIRFPDLLLGLFVPEPRGRLQSLQTPH